jgi:hypothetical protein
MYTDSGHLLQALTGLNAFWSGITTLLPASVTVTVAQSGQIYDDVTGLVAGTWSNTTGGAFTGSAGGAFSSPVGASIRLRTGATVGRHILNGRIFLVPLAGSAFNASGVLTPANVTLINTKFALAFTASGDFLWKVWHRPTAAAPSTGISVYASAYSITNKAAVLRSRRD